MFPRKKKTSIKRDSYSLQMLHMCFKENYPVKAGRAPYNGYQFLEEGPGDFRFQSTGNEITRGTTELCSSALAQERFLT
jgi:hypothetical protein